MMLLQENRDFFLFCLPWARAKMFYNKQSIIFKTKKDKKIQSTNWNHRKIFSIYSYFGIPFDNSVMIIRQENCWYTSMQKKALIKAWKRWNMYILPLHCLINNRCIVDNNLVRVVSQKAITLQLFFFNVRTLSQIPNYTWFI